MGSYVGVSYKVVDKVVKSSYAFQDVTVVNRFNVSDVRRTEDMLPTLPLKFREVNKAILAEYIAES